MLKRLLELKDFCLEQSKSHPSLEIEPIVWDKIREIHEALKPIATLTAQLQNEQLNVTQFVGYWKSAMFSLDAVKSNESLKLFKSILEREKTVFNNEIVLSNNPKNSNISQLFLDLHLTRILKTFGKAKPSIL
jgi:hypothetical protein